MGYSRTSIIDVNMIVMRTRTYGRWSVVNLCFKQARRVFIPKDIEYEDDHLECILFGIT
jgi:hypothetical protein